MKSKKPKHRVLIFYKVYKGGPQDSPNERHYYISNFYGDPFARFELPSDIEKEQQAIATALGLPLNVIEFVKRGPNAVLWSYHKNPKQQEAADGGNDEANPRANRERNAGAATHLVR